MEKIKITKETDEAIEVELEDLPQDIQQGYKEHGYTDNSSTLTIVESEEI